MKFVVDFHEKAHQPGPSLLSEQVLPLVQWYIYCDDLKNTRSGFWPSYI